MSKGDKMMEVNEITEKLQSADMVLIGVGEELDTGPEIMRGREPYAQLLAEAEKNKNTEWLIPFFFAHYLQHERDAQHARAYNSLARVLQGKDYFVVTVCMDGRIYDSGLDAQRIVAPCGGYERLQCSGECQGNLQPARQAVEELVEKCRADCTRLREICPPACAVCGREYSFNHIQQEYQEEGYLPQWDRYTKWLQGTLHQKLCVLELGVGMRYPTVIRWPFEKVAFFNQRADFIRVHSKLYQLSEELCEKGTSVARHPLELLTSPDFAVK